jgi:hypothetical protein
MGRADDESCQVSRSRLAFPTVPRLISYMAAEPLLIDASNDLLESSAEEQETVLADYTLSQLLTIWMDAPLEYIYRCVVEITTTIGYDNTLPDGESLGLLGAAKRFLAAKQLYYTGRLYCGAKGSVKPRTGVCPCFNT